MFILSIVRIIISVLKNKNLKIIVIIFIIGIGIYGINSLINNNNNDDLKINESLENTDDADLISCANKGYFISKLQGEIYDRESSNVTINITNCSSFLNTKSISVRCNYTRTWNSGYETTGNYTRKRVDKLFHSNQYSCK